MTAPFSTTAWRGPSPTGGGTTPAGPVWRQPAPRWRPRVRRWWPAVVLAAFAGCIGLATWLALWHRPPATTRILVWEAGYADTLLVPHNAPGVHAGRDLLALAAGGHGLAAGPATPLRRGTVASGTWADALEGVRDRAVVLVFAAHGGRDPGGPYLVPDDATPDPAHRLHVRDVITRLGRLPPGQHKLLVLDPAQAPADGPLGDLPNDFARGLDDLDAEIRAVPNLVVVCGSGRDERSWVCPEWGRSAFAHFLLAGLRGAADENRDTRLTALEVVRYTRDHTRDWVRANRGAAQTPVLLPAGDEGEARAARMPLAVTARGLPPAPAEPTPFAPPAALTRAWAEWTEWTELATADPPPEAYTPRAWREYGAWTVRYERLLDARRPDAADRDDVTDPMIETALAHRRRLAGEIAAARSLLTADLRAVRSQTFALPTVAGTPLPAPVRLTDLDVDALRGRAAPAADGAKPPGLSALLARAGADPTAARLALAAGLVEWVRADPAGRLRDLAPAVRELTAGVPVRPAELHFLAMLDRDLPRGRTGEPLAPAALVQTALAVRGLAERAAVAATGPEYPYPEIMSAWLHRHVESADAARRRGEDLLFATQGTDWDAAARRFAAAQQEYDRVLADAARLRRVVVAYHRGADRLTAAAVRLADRATSLDVRDQQSADAAVAAVRMLWGDWRALGRSVASAPDGDDGVLAVRLDGVAAEAAALDEKLRAIEADDAAEVTALLKSIPGELDDRRETRQQLVRWWHGADRQRAVPPGPADDPAVRVRLLAEQRRVSRQLLVARPDAAGLPDVPAAEARRLAALVRARRHGLLALARLGPADAAPADAAAVLNNLGFLPDSAAPDLARTGEALRTAWVRAADRASIPPTPADVGRLAGLDGLARTIPASLPRPDAANPSADLRRLRVAALLDRQAGRTVADYWSGGDGRRPYFRDAGDGLLADARKLGGTQWPPRTRGLDGDENPSPFTPQSAPTLVLTDDPAGGVVRAPVRQAVGPYGPGYAVAWADPPPGWPRADAGYAGARRVVDTAAAGPQSVDVAVTPPPLPTPTPDVIATTSTVTTYFRGRTTAARTAVEWHPTPDVVAVRVTPPPAAAVLLSPDPAVRARYGRGTGTIVFVLDCSGSMRPEPGTKGRYLESLDLFRDLVGALPAGVRVGVMVFGRKPAADAKEPPIETVVPPAEWDGPADGRLGKMLGTLAGFEPWDKSPITRAVVRAKGLAAADRVGPRAVVVLTDGVDNPPEKTTADTLTKAFSGSGVALHVVTLPPRNPDEAAEQAKWQVVTQFTPAGQFVPLKDLGSPDAKRQLDGLAAELVRAVNPDVRYQITAPGADPSGPWDAGRWHRLRAGAGDYRLRLERGPTDGWPFTADPGDRLLLRLTAGDGRPRLSRGLYTDEHRPVGRPVTTPDGWVFAALQVEDRRPGLQALAVLEDRPRAGDPVRAARVGEAWFELSAPARPERRPRVRWADTPGYPAPAWGFDVADWPRALVGDGPTRPELRAWWAADGRFAAGLTVPFPNGGDASALAGRSEPTPHGRVTIDRVAVERDPVGGPDVLAVRLTHPPGRPYLVRLAGVEPAASEQRLFPTANRVTAVFRPAAGETAADLARRAAGLELVPLADAKAAAEKRGHSAVLDGLPEPTPASVRPPSPVP